jgi:hypothetical protein
MASSSSASSIISFESESSREPTPEYDPIAAYEVRAPLHWDAEEWDFHSQSEDDKSLTDDEDLALLLGAELEEDDEDDASWEEDFSSSEERVDSFSSEEDPMAGNFLFGRSLKKPKMMVASPATAAGATTAATAVATIVVLALPRRPSVARPLAYTGGRL